MMTTSLLGGPLSKLAVPWFKDPVQYLPNEFESSNNIIEVLFKKYTIIQ